MDHAPAEATWTKRRCQLDVDRIVIGELLLGFYGLLVINFAWANQNWGIFIYASVFTAGLLMMAFASIAHAFATYRDRIDRKAQLLLENQTWSVESADESRVNR